MIVHVIFDKNGGYVAIDHICLLAIDHILGFLFDIISCSKIVGVILRYY